MSALIPRSRDQNQLNIKRKIEQKYCIIKKRPNTILFEIKKTTKNSRKSENAKNSKKHKVTV